MYLPHASAPGRPRNAYPILNSNALIGLDNSQRVKLVCPANMSASFPIKWQTYWRAFVSHSNEYQKFEDLQSSESWGSSSFKPKQLCLLRQYRIYDKSNIIDCPDHQESSHCLLESGHYGNGRVLPTEEIWWLLVEKEVWRDKNLRQCGKVAILELVKDIYYSFTQWTTQFGVGRTRKPIKPCIGGRFGLALCTCVRFSQATDEHPYPPFRLIQRFDWST